MALIQTPDAVPGSRAPDFELPGVDGRVYRLADIRGAHGTLIMFLCAHCPYVQAIETRLAADIREIQDAGVGVAAICSNDASRYPGDSPDRLRAQAERVGFGFPYLVDASQEVARSYGAVCTPDFFGYDQNLRLRYRGQLDGAHRKPRPPGMRRDLVEAMQEIALRDKTAIEQVPSMGCSIKWRE